MKAETPRRSVLKKVLASLASLAGIGGAAASPAISTASGKQVFNATPPSQEVPLYSGSVKQGGFVFVSGQGAHFEGDITSHTKRVLDDLEKELKKAGSSMDKVVKVNVYLADLNDYAAMNEVYRGRFGNKPPVRTTVATYGGVPGDSLVEIDCIAAV